LHANDGVRVLIEGILPVKDVEGYGILFNLIGLAGEGFLAQIGK